MTLKNCSSGFGMRGRWPEVEVEIRADAGFAVPALYDYCEAEGIAYTPWDS